MSAAEGGVAWRGLFFTLGSFRLWQRTNLWRININYAAQHAPPPPFPAAQAGENGGGEGGKAGRSGAVVASYLLAATTDDDATKSALNTHYVGEVHATPSFPVPSPLPLSTSLALYTFARLKTLGRHATA